MQEPVASPVRTLPEEERYPHGWVQDPTGGWGDAVTRGVIEMLLNAVTRGGINMFLDAVTR